MKKLLVLDGIAGVPLGSELSEACTESGLNVIHYDCAKFSNVPFYRVRAAYTKALNKQVDKESYTHLPRANPEDVERLIDRLRPDCILVIGFVYKFINPRLLKNLARKYDCSLFLYDTDSCNLFSRRREFIFFLEHELPEYDRIFSFSKVMTNFLVNTRKLNAIYFPYGAKNIDLPLPAVEMKDVLFVGSGDLRRIFLLESIKSKVSIYGNRWERNYPLMSEELKNRVVDKAVWGEELHQLFADSKIVLNITRTQFYGAETGINLRIFEALAAGSFLLTDYCDEVAELFETGKEIETFKSSGELVTKVNFYLENPEKRQAIAKAGHCKFMERYTWSTRAKELVTLMSF